MDAPRGASAFRALSPGRASPVTQAPGRFWEPRPRQQSCFTDQGTWRVRPSASERMQQKGVSVTKKCGDLCDPGSSEHRLGESSGGTGLCGTSGKLKGAETHE